MNTAGNTAVKGSGAAVKNHLTYHLIPEMTVCFLITYAASCACLERRLPDDLGLIYSWVMVAVCGITWLWTAFMNGRRGKWGFAVFSGILWILPQLVVLIAGEELHGVRKNTVSFFLSELCGIFSSALLEKLFGWLSDSTFIGAVISAAICVLFWYCGRFTVKFRKNRRPDDGKKH